MFLGDVGNERLNNMTTIRDFASETGAFINIRIYFSKGVVNVL